VSDPNNLLTQINVTMNCGLQGGTLGAYGNQSIHNWFNNSDILDAPLFGFATQVIQSQEIYDCEMRFIMPSDVDNYYQGRTASFDLVFTATQEI
jgi:hypothetical protein